MFPFMAGCRDAQIGDARERRGVRSAGTLHTREAGRFRSSRLKRTTKSTFIRFVHTRHNLQSAGRAAERHMLELVETHHDHRHPLTAANTHRFKPVYAESGPLNRADPHITPAGYGRYSRLVSGSLVIPFTARNGSGLCVAPTRPMAREVEAVLGFS